MSGTSPIRQPRKSPFTAPPNLRRARPLGCHGYPRTVPGPAASQPHQGAPCRAPSRWPARHDLPVIFRPVGSPAPLGLAGSEAHAGSGPDRLECHIVQTLPTNAVHRRRPAPGTATAASGTRPRVNLYHEKTYGWQLANIRCARPPAAPRMRYRYPIGYRGSSEHKHFHTAASPSDSERRHCPGRLRFPHPDPRPQKRQKNCAVRRR